MAESLEWRVLLCMSTALLFSVKQADSLVIVIPTDLTVEAPGRAVIECHYSVCPGLSWEGPAININRGPPRYTIDSERTTTSLLTINPVREEDEGEYYCTCSDGRSAGPSNLLVNHPPSLEGVNQNQTFHRGETAAVECNADLGDPQRELSWVRNGMRVLPGSPRLRLSDLQVLIIEDITDSDAGLYQCVVFTSNGPLVADITVNVIDPILLPLVDPSLPRYLPITFGQPLHLNCKNQQAQADGVLFSWIDPNGEEVASNHVLEVAPEDIIPGVYRCLVQIAPGDEMQQSVVVTVLDTPPILVAPENEIINIQAIEQEAYSFREEFKYRLDRSDLSVEWKRLRSDELVDFSFGSRFTFNISGTELRFDIHHAQLTDRGRYLVNISNQFNSTSLRVEIYVLEIIRTTMQIPIAGVSCRLVEENMETIASQVADEFNCSYCGVNVLHAENHCEDEDTNLSIVEITLGSRWILPEEMQVSVRFANFTFETVARADISGTPEVLVSSPNLVTAAEAPVVQQSSSPNLAAIIVPVSIVLFFIIGGGIVLYSIYKCKRGYGKDIARLEGVSHNAGLAFVDDTGEHVYESIDDLTVSLAHATSPVTNSLCEVNRVQIEDPGVSSLATENRNGLPPEAEPVADPMERGVLGNGNLMQAGSAAASWCQATHYELLNNPRVEEERDSMHSHTLLQQSSNQEPAGGKQISGCESKNYDPILDHAAMEYHGRPEEEMANIEVREVTQDQSIRESPQNSPTCGGDHEIISGYERVRYNLRLEQVLLEISQRQDRNNPASGARVQQEGSETNLECGCVNFEYWMEQALMEHRRTTGEFSRWIGNAVMSQERKPAAPPQSGSDLGSRSGTNQEYERVIYDPRLEQALLEYQRRAEEGKSDPLLLRQLLNQLEQRTSQASNYENISGYERVQYDLRLEQVLLEISRRRQQNRNISESVSCANGGQESSEIDLDCDCIYDSWMEQAFSEYQKTASEFGSLASQEGEPVAPGERASFAVADADQGRRQNRETNQGYERVNYDPRLERAWMRAQRRVLEGHNETAHSTMMDPAGNEPREKELHMSSNSPNSEVAVMSPCQRTGGDPSQRAPSSSSELGEPRNQEEHVYEVISGYERVNYDPWLIRALLQNGHASRQGTHTITL